MDEHIGRIDDGRVIPPLTLLTPAEALLQGLQLVYTERKICRVEGDPSVSQTNIQRFKDHCGANPVVIAKSWEDLQTTTIDEASRLRVLKFDAFLEALNWLYQCHRESESEARFDKAKKTLRK